MIKFDTRDKKPNLYGLLALAVLFAAVIGLLIHLYGDKSGLNVCLLIAAFCLISIIYLLITLREQIRYNPYSYNTIYYVGFAVFALFVMTAHIVLAFLMTRHPESYGSEKIARYLLNSARDFMKYTSPLILVFSVSLFVSNVSLIRHEGKRLVWSRPWRRSSFWHFFWWSEKLSVFGSGTIPRALCIIWHQLCSLPSTFILNAC